VARNGVNRPHRSPLDPRGWGWETWFLAAVPTAIVAAALDLPPVVRFATAALAIIPLAGLMGRSTEAIAHRLGPGIGGLLNATFGNAAELILALLALRRGLDGVVKASLAGSIIGNLLLVLGASLLAGGIKYPVQRFNRTAAGNGSTLMVLASVGLLIPALFHGMVGPGEAGLEHTLSLGVSVMLILAYGLNLLFNLVTHKDLFGHKGEKSPLEEEGAGPWGLRRSAVVLLVATGFVAAMSEILVEAVVPAGEALGMSEVFMGVIVVAIVGNAAEHSTAILMAMKDQMDLAVGIALGSALQVALFVAPVLVFASYLRPTHGPMDLLFSTFEVVSVILAAIVARMAAEDGESNWLEGAMLLMIYVILGFAFYLLPAGHPGGPP
jgi:Ca2+:H+ antiporter